MGPLSHKWLYPEVPIVRTVAPMKTTPPPAALANLGPLAQLRAGRLPERLLRLLAGLWLYGLAIALMIEGALGASPWDVFHLGLAQHLSLSLGTVMVIAALGVLLAWIPLRQMPGLGTVANTLLLGPFADANLALVETPHTLWLRGAFLLGGVLVCAFATARSLGRRVPSGMRPSPISSSSAWRRPR